MAKVPEITVVVTADTSRLEQQLLEAKAALGLVASRGRRQRLEKRRQQVRRQRRWAMVPLAVGLCLSAWLVVNAQPTLWHAVLLLVAVGLCMPYLATLWWFERL